MTTVSSPSILVVDDEESVRRLLTRVLDRGGYRRVATVSSTEEARALLDNGEIDLVLTDMQMPGGSGLDLLDHIHSVMPDVASVMITVIDDTALAEKALSFGAYGYIVKPFRGNEVLINVSNALRRRKLELENRDHRDRLEGKVKERTSELWTALQTVERREQDLRVSQEDTIQRLSIAAEFRDDETASHLKRMSRYCGLLSGWAGLDRERSEMIRIATIMHDVGKIGIPDNILLKVGQLTLEEYAFMQQHAEFGHRILAGSTSELLTLAASIALTHHEKWDGSGYPSGLKGEDIPLEGRIAAVADVFDAVITNRIYRKAFEFPDAIKIMKAGRGSQFDPELLDLFMDHLDEILSVKKQEEDASRASLPAIA